MKKMYERSIPFAHAYSIDQKEGKKKTSAVVINSWRRSGDVFTSLDFG